MEQLTQIFFFFFFYLKIAFCTPPPDSDGVLSYHVGHLCVCLSYVHPYFSPSIFLFPDDNSNKCQWIFTKLGVSIDIVGIWFGMANGQN